MLRLPEYQLAGEIRRILRTGPPAEILLRVHGPGFDPARPETALLVRALDPRGRAYSRRGAASVRVLLVVTVDFVEQSERPERNLRFAPPAEGAPGPHRILGYDSRVAGVVVRHVGEELFVVDAGLPLLVRLPEPTALPPVGEYVEFLVQSPVIAEIE